MPERSISHPIEGIIDLLIGSLIIFCGVNGLLVLLSLLLDTSLAFKADFYHYYLSALIGRGGEIPYGVSFLSLKTDWDFFFHGKILFATNPPLLVLLFVPLSFLSPIPAHSLWQAGMVLSVFYVHCILSVYLGLSRPITIIVFVAVLCSNTFQNCIFYSQAQPYILCCVICGWSLIRANRCRLGSFVMGFSVAVKFFTWPVAIPILLLMGFRGFLAFMAGLSFGIFIPVLIWGTEVYSAFLNSAVPILNFWADYSFLNTNPGYTLYHFVFLDNGPENVVWIKWTLTQAIGLLFCLVLVGRLIAIGNIKAKADSIFLSTIFISFITSPSAWPSYQLAYIIPIYVFLSNAKTQRIRLVDLIIFIMSALIVFVPYAPLNVEDAALRRCLFLIYSFIPIYITFHPLFFMPRERDPFKGCLD